MYMLFQHLLFISLNLYCTKSHIQYHEYTITFIIFTIYYHFLQGIQGTMYLLLNVDLPKRTVYEDRFV